MNNENNILRDYQLEMKSHLLKEWEFHRSVMVQMPTGTGKTHLLAAIVKEFLDGSGEGEVWIVAHRRELVEQIEGTVARYEMGKDDRRIRVFSIQWLSRNRRTVEGSPALIVIDEAHHALATTYRMLWEIYPDTRKLGMTATPCRLDRKGFAALFDTLITSWSVAEFIGRGWLSSFDYVSVRPDSLEQRWVDSLTKRGADGDYQVREMDAVLNCPSGIGRLYRGMMRYAAGKKGIVYAVSIGHARQIATCYNSHGVPSAAIDSRTPARERKTLVEKFREGRIRVLVNVDIFSEGFDCPDVEFVQLARPTLSLAKYLQQVGRGLRKSGSKESCILIDHVGLHRLFGLPTNQRDWHAMFDGRLVGNVLSRIRTEGIRTDALHLQLEERDHRDEELEVVVTHVGLLAALRDGASAVSAEVMVGGGKEPIDEETRGGLPTLRACYDRRSGLWGLRRGEIMTAKPWFREVYDVCGSRAAVRLKDNCTDVLSVRESGPASGGMWIVDDGGRPEVQLDDCRKVKFIREDLIVMTDSWGKKSYIDLKTGRRYKQKPSILSFGGVELLKVEEVFHSRTRKAYAAMHGLIEKDLCFCDFYLRIPDYRVPKECWLVDPMWTTSFDIFACVLEGDDEEVYRCCGRLADQSIVVRDAEGNYYHAEKGKKKRYVACHASALDGTDFATVMEQLKEEARRRIETAQRKQLQEEELKRQRRLDEMRNASPFCIGNKWGLKLGKRIVVPPRYRKILPPVGDYCVYEENACQWGVMSLDGRVVVEARYQAVDINNNGTARLTIIPGKVKIIKL